MNVEIDNRTLADLLRAKHAAELAQSGDAAKRARVSTFELAKQVAVSNPDDPVLQALPGNLYLDLVNHADGIEKRSIRRDRIGYLMNAISLLIGLAGLILGLLR